MRDLPRPNGPRGAWGARLAIAGLAAGVAVAVLMLVLKPAPGGRHYEYAVFLSLGLTAIALLYAARPAVFFGRGVLVFVLAAGLGLAVLNFRALDPGSEIIHTYRTVFEALESGRNPYTSGTIYHTIQDSGPVLGNFNYPPLEILPYYAAYRLAGTWNRGVLTVTIIVLQALAFLVLVRTFPRTPVALLLPFLPLVVLGEIKTSAAVTVLLTALVLAVIEKSRESPRPVHGYLIAGLFGLGLTAKFLMIPLMAAYYWHQFDRRDLRSLAGIAVDGSIAAAAAILVMAPFGVINVLKNTILFNAVLEDRAALTTFYPNVVSGPFAWAGISGLYPLAAVGLLAAAVLAAPRLRLYTAMFAAAVVFLLVSPTPEPQFVPALIVLVVVAQAAAREGRGHEAGEEAEAFIGA